MANAWIFCALNSFSNAHALVSLDSFDYSKLISNTSLGAAQIFLHVYKELFACSCTLSHLPMGREAGIHRARALRHVIVRQQIPSWDLLNPD